MNNINRNATVGIIDCSNFESDNYLHFAEWWSGEGLDFELTSGKKTQRFNLHMDEMTALVTAAIATGMVDVDVCVSRAKELNEKSEEKQKLIQQLNNKDW